MSTFSTLEVGKRALIAQKFGLEVTSNNIANVNTAGYSRRSVSTTETGPRKTTAGFIGTGAIVDNLKTYREEFFDKEIRKTIALQAGYASDQTILERVEAVLAEPTEMGIGEAAQMFISSFEDLAGNPQDLSLRENTLQTAKTLVDRLHKTAEQLDDSRNDIMTDLESNVTKMNQLLEQAAVLNKNVSQTNAQNAADAQTYIDKRENVLEELSELAGISVTQDEHGQINAFVNGVNVLTGPLNSTIEIQENVNTITGERTAVLAKKDANGKTVASITPAAGEMASQLKAYNTLLDPSDSSGEFSVYSKLNTYTDAIIRNVNQLTVGGYGLDDTGNIPPGRAFFTPSEGNISAHNIEINPEILNDVRAIPVSDTAGEYGNNVIALKLGRLSNYSEFIDNQNPTEYYSGILGRLGSISVEALNGKNTTDIIVEQLSNQREAVIGVDIDEEAVSLIKFQKAFEASSRVVNMTNEILSTIVNLGR